MIAASVEWPRLCGPVLSRIDERAAAASGDEELALLVRAHAGRSACALRVRNWRLTRRLPLLCCAQKLRRTLAETDREVTSFKALFEEFLGEQEEEWEARARRSVCACSSNLRHAQAADLQTGCDANRRWWACAAPRWCPRSSSTCSCASAR
jgi:hypothetical protein